MSPLSSLSSSVGQDVWNSPVKEKTDWPEIDSGSLVWSGPRMHLSQFSQLSTKLLISYSDECPKRGSELNFYDFLFLFVLSMPIPWPKIYLCSLSGLTLPDRGKFLARWSYTDWSLKPIVGNQSQCRLHMLQRSNIITEKSSQISIWIKIQFFKELSTGNFILFSTKTVPSQ